MAVRRRAAWHTGRALSRIPACHLTGQELWSAKLDARGNANPMTYEGKDGKQYVAIVAGSTLNVFALP
jgi:glucose dehydrogenase